MTAPSKVEFWEIDTESEVRECFVLMHQLRPHLVTEDEFVERWQRQRRAGYRLIGLWGKNRLLALAGFRVMENLVHGVHLYVDDLVTSGDARGQGYGGEMLRWLQEEGRARECGKLLLDTPVSNLLAHRFYYRNGLLGTAWRFSMALEDGAPVV